MNPAYRFKLQNRDTVFFSNKVIRTRACQQTGDSDSLQEGNTLRTLVEQQINNTQIRQKAVPIIKDLEVFFKLSAGRQLRMN